MGGKNKIKIQKYRKRTRCGIAAITVIFHESEISSLIISNIASYN